MKPPIPDLPISVTLSLDTSGLKCPMPVLKAQRVLRTLEAGAVVEVISTDAVSLKEMPLFCEQVGHALLASEEAANGSYRFLILKAPPADL